MHRFWTIPEVASIAYLQLSRRDCARLARVHSVIWACVVHLVWDKVPRISCLSDLLPDVDFKGSDASSTQVPLTERQWTRFDIHAKFIKNLKVEVQGGDAIVLMMLQKLWAQRPSGSPRSFIHAITHLTVVLPDSSSALSSTNGWSLLFSSTLLSLNLTFRATVYPAKVEENLVPCLEALRTCSPDLRNVGLSGTPESVARLLKSINPWMVRKVVVEDRGLGLWGYHGGRSPENVLPVGALGRFPKLEELEFNLAIHSFSTLLPLQNSFQRLICISIGPNYYATCWMSQQTLPQLAALLPRIEELRILDDRRRITTVSLQTLQCFAVSCRHLRKLRIPIYDRSTTGTAHIQPHPSIREIDFRYSTIATDSDTEAVARTIAAMFPSLVSFGYIGKYDRASDWEDVAGALVQLLPGLKVSAPDDDVGTYSFEYFFSGALETPCIGKTGAVPHTSPPVRGRL
ncbi:hypothetical protein FRC05_007574 [Tulasnella sp. 425]|nr:hypothetical protein FRC05_007574 [Tulasnella sp. 425]